jgi:hypothetical protein
VLLSSAQTRKGEPPETTHLIDSVKGPALYTAYCSVCHGSAGKGDGPMPKALKVAPPDLIPLPLEAAARFRWRGFSESSRARKPCLGDTARGKCRFEGLFFLIAWDQDLGRVRVNNLAKYIESMQAN